MKGYNIYMTGVGGQGIGLLSEVLLRAADYAGYDFKAVDTHGLAQRGGIVVSQLRIGQDVFTPLIPKGDADVVVALERHEALRGLNEMGRDQSTLVYYDTVWQPLGVRLGSARQVSAEQLKIQCKQRNIRLVRVHDAALADVRMQNIAVLAQMNRQGLIEGIVSDHYRQAMGDLMAGGMLDKNLALFDDHQAHAL